MIHYCQENIKAAVAEIGKISHMEALNRYLPEILEPETDNSFSRNGKIPLKAAIFNLERGHYLAQTTAYFLYNKLLRDLDVIFANELDCGMARTGNLHITRELAAALGMNYAYGVEFLSSRAGLDGNREGFHGNAIISKFPLERVKVVHLPIKYDWFYRQGDQRLGVRNAILAEITTKDKGKIGLVCTHLENRATPQERTEQLEFLLDAAENHFGGIPILLGGDMNTNTVAGDKPGEMDYLADNPDEQWRRLGQIPVWEPQLDFAAVRGYSYIDCNIMAKTTRRKPMPDGRTILLNLDWFYQRGLNCSNPVRVESIFHCDGLRGGAPEEIKAYQGQELSDHDIVLVTCERAAT